MIFPETINFQMELIQFTLILKCIHIRERRKISEEAGPMMEQGQGIILFLKYFLMLFY